VSIRKALDDGTSYIKASYHEPEDKLTGIWHVYRKLDGVRVLRNKSDMVVSRNSKELFNVGHLEFKDAELFHIDWSTSVSITRSEFHVPADQSMVYELRDGYVDERLYLGKVLNPDWAKLEYLMNLELAKGNEGLVLRKFNQRKGIYDWLKVVPKKQADVRITGFKEGTGRLKGTLGSIQTNHGSVGSGFDDKGRYAIWHNRGALMGAIIQVEYREVTEKGKLRFPAFVRFREDKNEESI
jgi:ATP-dependent DNA ligase